MGVNALQVVLRLLCAFDGERWLRIAATMVEDDNIEAQKHMLEAYPSCLLYTCIGPATEIRRYST